MRGVHLAPHLVRVGQTLRLDDKSTGTVVRLGKVFVYVAAKGGVRRIHPNNLPR